ncbi:MAG: hypothetical protein WBB07_23945 [Mycobacterium sp.]
MSTSSVAAPSQTARAQHQNLLTGNLNRTRDAAERTVAKAQHAVTVLKANPASRRHDLALQQEYLDILQARIDRPNASLAEIGGALGMTKDRYASSLRRALLAATSIERKAAAA